MEEGKTEAHQLQHVVKENVSFAKKIYQALSSQEKGKNLIFSPLSAHAVLSLVYQGASGKTAQDLEKTLELCDKETTAVGYNGVINALNDVQKVALDVVNGIFVMKDFPLTSKFEKVSRESFLSETQELDFKQGARSAATINAWVEKKTNSKIKDLVKAQALDGQTRLVLVNAVYFNGKWDEPFKKYNTEIMPFYVSSTVKVDCKMMYNDSHFRYTEDPALDAKILELPYENKDVSLIVILPNNKTDGIAELEKKLQDYDLTEIGSRLQSVDIKVYLPKFKIEATMDLKSLLTQIGLGVIFDPHEADFSEISTSPERLYVSKVVQKAFIEVNEEGTEAAAATMMVAVNCCALISLSEPIRFVADHPFVYMLVKKQQSSSLVLPLFVGKVVDPTCKP